MTDTTITRSPAAVTAWAQRLVEPALRRITESLPEEMRLLAEYHFGWCDAQGTPVTGGGGKLLRPAMTLLAAQAVGADAGQAISGASAVELVHNFSLLHDDVMDRDATRRHRPTAWTVFGIGPAVLAGDLLLSLAYEELAERPAASRLLGGAVLDLLAGQSADLAFMSGADISRADSVKMALGKTAALLGCSAALGALDGGGTQDQVERLQTFGTKVGLAFQHVDDLLGIWGDPSVTGKAVYSDLANRKRSLPVVAALTSEGPAAAEFAELYGEEGTIDLVRAAVLIEAAGGRDWSRAEADRLLAEALAELDTAWPGSAAATELAALAGLLVHRSY